LHSLLQAAYLEEIPNLMGMPKQPDRKIRWIDEYQNGMRFGLEGEVLVDEESPFQRITVVQSKKYGKGLLLDGCWMTAELQEKEYHESLVHPALSSANEITNVLIIGGGDGGSARECLKYQEVQKIDLVEIDQRVVELSKQYIPSIGGKSWTDPRLNIKIEDGIKWVQNSQDNSYDIVIIDGSDPKGPAKGLFNEAFFRDCKRILKPKGIFATQSESPESFIEIHIDMVNILRDIFKFADPLYGWVPIYPSGWWSWTFASIEEPFYLYPIQNRAAKIAKDCKIWNARWQQGAFHTMPNFIEKKLRK